MMISEFYDSFFYWGVLLLLVFIGAWFLKAKPFDFQFLVLLVSAQYAVHSLLGLGLDNSVTIYCLLFYFLLVIFGQRRKKLKLQIELPKTNFTRGLSRKWVAVSRLYLLVYFPIRLTVYPFFSGELILADRLVAQGDHPFLYMAGLAVTPATTAVIYSLLRPADAGFYKYIDQFLLILVTIGTLGAGSKAGLIGLVFNFIGVASYLNISVLRYKWALFGALTAILASVYLLLSFFPDLNLYGVGNLILYRVVANTDSLEYLIDANLQPSDYPFSGVGALFPHVFKRLGYEFQYPPGVWLHGMRFGVWDGYGPNSGIVMDYFGNLGWLGLVVPILTGLYMKACNAYKSVIFCSFLSMAYVIVADVALFDIAWSFWILILIFLLLVKYQYKEFHNHRSSVVT